MKTVIPILFFICLCVTGYSQRWSVDPNAYTYTMNVTAILRVEGVYLNNEMDTLAAFVGDECRGVTELVHLSQKDSSLAFLTVYSNKQSGEKIHFKIYNSATDSEYVALNELNYLANDIIGNIDTPYIVFTNHFPTKLQLDNNQVYENNDTLLAIGKFSTTDPDTSDTFTYSFAAGIGDTDNNLFRIKKDELYGAIMFDYNQQQQYNIRVASTDGHGGVIEKNFVINVLESGVAPTVNDYVFEIEENSIPGTLVGKVHAVDDDPVLIYRIIQGNTNNSFDLDSITGNLTVAANAIIDYEKQSSYDLVLEVSDGTNEAVPFNVKINILDVAETAIATSQVVTPNDDGYNDYFKIENINSITNYTLYIYNDEQELVYQTNLYNNDWNGNSKSLPEGTYYFLLKAKDDDQSKQGFISIVR